MNPNNYVRRTTPPVPTGADLLLAVLVKHSPLLSVLYRDTFRGNRVIFQKKLWPGRYYKFIHASTTY